MPDAPARYMRVMVFFDLPVKTRAERREYSHFRHFLQSDGFDMLQFSVYSRLVAGDEAARQHVERVKSHLPPAGSVRALVVTDKQYGRMQHLIGPPTKHEQTVQSQQLLLL